SGTSRSRSPSRRSRRARCRSSAPRACRSASNSRCAQHRPRSPGRAVMKPNEQGSLAGRHVLLGVTGGIAAYKAVLLVRLLMKAGASVQVVMTQAATRFVGPDTFTALSGRPARTEVFDEVEHVLHVRLAHEADVAVVAPATANVIARVALGMA